MFSIFALTNKIYYAIKRRVGYIYLKILGVSVPYPGPRIDKFPNVQMAFGSSIIIGRDCVLASGSKINPAGISRRVMLCTLGTGSRLTIGNEVKMSGSVLCAAKSIIVGDRAQLGVNTSIYDTDFHPIDALKRSAQTSVSEARVEPVEIQNDVWLGASVIVLKGVVIGACSVIGAGSIVTKDIPCSVIACGNPSRVIAKINPISLVNNDGDNDPR